MITRTCRSITRNRTVAGLVATVSITLALAACGSPSTQPADTTTAVAANETDISFAQQMIPHHRQAVEMAALAMDRSNNPAILDLADRIQGAQDPEIDLMQSWLDAWGRDATEADMGGGTEEDMEEMDHDAMEGMMSDDELASLTEASGSEFDMTFVAMMIRHHEGAISMAATVIADGTDPEVRPLAEAIISAQQGEIDEMQALELTG